MDLDRQTTKALKIRRYNIDESGQRVHQFTSDPNASIGHRLHTWLNDNGEKDDDVGAFDIFNKRIEKDNSELIAHYDAMFKYTRPESHAYIQNLIETQGRPDRRKYNNEDMFNRAMNDWDMNADNQRTYTGLNNANRIDIITHKQKMNDWDDLMLAYRDDEQTESEYSSSVETLSDEQDNDNDEPEPAYRSALPTGTDNELMRNFMGNARLPY